MTWRLSDLPVETRLAAEHAAAAQGRTLQTWLIETVRSSLAGTNGMLQTESSAEPVSVTSLTMPRLQLATAADAREPGIAEVPSQEPSPRADPWQLLRARLAEAEHQGDGGEQTTDTTGDAIFPFKAEPPAPPEWVPAPEPPRSRGASPSIPDPAIAARPSARPALPSGPVTLLPLTALLPPRNRLRRGSDEHRLPALARETTAQGVREPVLVRGAKDAGAFEIIAGERRRLAAERAGKTEIPAIIVDANDAEALVLSLMENRGRSDFTPLDEARAYLRLLTEFRLNPTTLAERLGVERLHIASSLRLLGLPSGARDVIESGRLSADQAFRLLEASNPEAAARQLAAAAPRGPSG